MDVDLLFYPPHIIQTLLDTGKEIVQPHCVLEPGGRTFDQNAWTAPGIHMDRCRAQSLVRLNAVGGTMLLVKADLHRDGLVFPTFRYGLPSEGIRPDGEGFIADARTGLDDFERETGIDLTLDDAEEGGVDSLGGLVISLLGRVPQRGEIVAHPRGYEFEVLEADPRRVRTLRIRGPRPAAT